MSIQKIVEKALQKAQAVQAVMLTQETSSVNFENDRLKSAESSQRTGPKKRSMRKDLSDSRTRGRPRTWETTAIL